MPNLRRLSILAAKVAPLVYAIGLSALPLSAQEADTGGVQVNICMQIAAADRSSVASWSQENRYSAMIAAAAVNAARQQREGDVSASQKPTYYPYNGFRKVKRGLNLYLNPRVNNATRVAGFVDASSDDLDDSARQQLKVAAMSGSANSVMVAVEVGDRVVSVSPELIGSFTPEVSYNQVIEGLDRTSASGLQNLCGVNVGYIVQTTEGLSTEVREAAAAAKPVVTWDHTAERLPSDVVDTLVDDLSRRDTQS